MSGRVRVSIAARNERGAERVRARGKHGIRRALAVLAVALLGMAPAVTLATPAGAKATSDSQCAPQQVSNESVAITITRIAPAYIRADQPITVLADLHNCGTAPLSK